MTKKGVLSAHLPTCACANVGPCPAQRVLHSEKPEDHWWSGCPGAVCMKCGSDDPQELCVAGPCACSCHVDFWAEYEKACTEGPPK